MHIDNNKKDILIPGKGLADAFDDTTLTAEKEYSINFTEQQKKFCLRLHYIGVNSYRFVNGVEIYKLKATDYETKQVQYVWVMCVPNETKEVNVKAFNMITRINEFKTLVKLISCDSKCKFNSTTCNSNQKWNNDQCQCECKRYVRSCL